MSETGMIFTEMTRLKSFSELLEYGENINDAGGQASLGPSGPPAAELSQSFARLMENGATPVGNVARVSPSASNVMRAELLSPPDMLKLQCAVSLATRQGTVGAKATSAANDALENLLKNTD